VPHTTPRVLDKLGDAEHKAETAIAEFGEHVHQELKDSGEKVRELVSPTKDDVDEGWVSDESAGSAQGSETGSKPRSRSLRQKSLGNTSPTGSTSRKRHSTRSKSVGGVVLRGEDDNNNRPGSRDLSPLRRALYDPDSRRGSLRNLRLESIRDTKSRPSRDQSPARSVHFVDRMDLSRTFTSTPERSSSLPYNPDISDDDSSQKIKATVDETPQTSH